MTFRLYMHLGNGRIIDIKSFRVAEPMASTVKSRWLSLK